MPSLSYKNTIDIQRDNHGVPHIRASSEEDLYFAMGYVQAMDRGLQMLLTRILCRGQGSLHLESSEDMLAIDTFFRRMDWATDCDQQVAQLNPTSKALAQSWCDGINARFAQKIPFEFRFLGYRPTPWTIADSIILSRMIGYIGLTQGQTEIERFFIEMVQKNVPREKLEEMFPGLLQDLDIELLKKVKLGERMVPESIMWNSFVPKLTASNNWAISGAKTASGNAIFANDPHLEVNRLPNIWQEMVCHLDSRYIMGAGMPGMPGIFIGRNNDIAWGATYTCMDSVDFWIEECRDGKYRRGNQWLPFTERRELIQRKKKTAIEKIFYYNEHGILEGNPHEEGYYLATRWSAQNNTGAKSLESIMRMLHTKEVAEGMELLGKIETSWNWVLADINGNIGYQMSGLLPLRPEKRTGFIPLPGWEAENDWQGFADPQDLPRAYNPEEGFILTANHNLNHLGKLDPINFPMSNYRAHRIRDLLKNKTSLAVEDMQQIQYDYYSLQAEKYMQILKPLLPETPQGEILKNWDCCYQQHSHGAYLFEKFYRALVCEVFGKKGMGDAVLEHLIEKTSLFLSLHGNMDRILLGRKSSWFGTESRDDLFGKVARRALDTKVVTWGSCQQTMLNHLLLGGKLPRFLGFDRGPVTICGGRATPHQGVIYTSGNRTSSFAPSFRLITDMGDNSIHTNIAGGPSDRRFSRWYSSDLANWQNGKYKQIKAQ